MVHDPDEWRRPWNEGERPAALAGPAASPSSLAAPSGAPSVAPSSATAAVAAAGAFAPSGPWDDVTSVRPLDAQATTSAPPRQRRGIGAAFLAGLVGAVVGTVATLGVVAPTSGTGGSIVPGAGAPGTAPSSGGVTPPAQLDGSGIPAVAAAVIPSVVRIDTLGNATVQGSVGSGVIYRADGYIITNNHVVAGASAITVRLADGELLEAELIGTDPLNDLAVVRIARTGLTAVGLRPAGEPLAIGETVVAIGSPFGLDTSVTAGIVSGVNREIRLDDAEGGLNTIPSAIQTDAAINPGNSGGALVDARGRLVGINTAILTRTGSNEGIGFAVSVAQAISSADQLIAQGFVRHPLLGITGLDVSPEAAARVGLETTRGAMIDSVADGSAADDAGLRPGDVVIALDGRPISTMSELVAEVRRRVPGDVVRLTVAGEGGTREVDVVLGERPRG